MKDYLGFTVEYNSLDLWKMESAVSDRLYEKLLSFKNVLFISLLFSFSSFFWFPLEFRLLSTGIESVILSAVEISY